MQRVRIIREDLVSTTISLLLTLQEQTLKNIHHSKITQYYD
jgi:hypothetical protein